MDAMTHDDLRELCGAYALGSLDPEDSSRLLTHLEDCKACRTEVAEHRATVELLGRLPEPAAPPANAEARLMSLVGEQRASTTTPVVLHPRVSSWESWSRWVLPAAATLVGGLALWSGWLYLENAELQGMISDAPAAAGPSPSVPATFRPIPLHPHDPSTVQVGKVTYRGGLQVEGDPSIRPRLGDLQDLVVSQDGSHLIAVTDSGWWVSAGLSYTADGNLQGIQNVRTDHMLGPDGEPLQGQGVESLQVHPGDSLGGELLVSFQDNREMARYSLGWEGFGARQQLVTTSAPVLDVVQDVPLAGFTRLSDGRLLTVADGPPDSPGDVPGRLVDGKISYPVSFRRQPPNRIADLATLPGGDVVSLQHSWNAEAGHAMEIHRIAAASIVPNAVLEGEVLVDLDECYNLQRMEGLSVRRGVDDEILLYVISEGKGKEPTVLMMFELQSP